MRKRMTAAEMRLWFRLRPLRREGFHFRRQSPVGRYILDFECRAIRLGLELDGAHHADAVKAARDAEREVWLESRGYLVLRFWNRDVIYDTDRVVHEILTAATDRFRALDVLRSE